ncbi:MAG: hypothetical protein U0800_25515 [Isosphaeraceae bacterium]
MRNLLGACLFLVTFAVPALAQEDVRFEVANDQRRVNAGDETLFTITLRNEGDAAASQLKVVAKFSAELQPWATDGTNQGARWSTKDRLLIFPVIATVDAGETLVLKIQAKALKAGMATCRVSITDTGLGGLTLEKDETVRVK